MKSKLIDRLKALHNDEQGAGMVEYILIIAAVVLPLLGIILWFWKDIVEWATEAYDDVRGGQETDPHSI